MRDFFYFISKILFIFISTSFLLESIYTFCYTEKTNYSKFQFIKNQKHKKYNYIFYGSSRVVNHINPKIIDSCLNRTSINFGVMDAKPKDILTLLKLTKFYNIKSDSIFVQTDYYYNSTDKSNFLYLDMLPYIQENSIIKSYYYDEKDYLFLVYFPFYKYLKNSSKLGMRDLLAALFRKNKFDTTIGYEPLYGNGNTWQRILPTSVLNNEINKETLQFMKTNGMNYVFFTAPFRRDTKNLNFVSQLRNHYPVFWDFSTSITESNLFKNGYHLNHTGAKEFSIIFSNKIKD
ncbi:hypothetical protein FLACOL_02561 [Flavobacterium columnare]|uniref:DUF1574 domain-containing protein n=3 Tax=Flavobacterium TaxID=237 RepID=A0A2N9PDY7_9FLAO|nr:hypothetical protein FLACOL_02561 [Flavobacterium columnare]